MEAEYKSSVMHRSVGYLEEIAWTQDGRPLCEFLGGNRDTETMLAVIRILDARLAKEEEYSRRLCEVIGVYHARETGQS